MNYSNLEKKKLKPFRDLIAFEWIKPGSKSKSEFLIPDSHYELDYRAGRYYFGKVKEVGNQVVAVKKNDILLVHEYGIKNYEGGWKEDFIYFIEEKNCKAIVKNIKGTLLELQRVIRKGEEDDLENS